MNINYFMIACINSLVGYLIGIASLFLFRDFWGVFAIGIFSSIASIAISFINYKLFVFKTIGNWVSELFRAYLVYGLSAFIGSVFLWIFIDIFSISIFISQALAIFLSSFIAYFGHQKFTFFQLKKDQSFN